jgi:hypothetical protein
MSVATVDIQSGVSTGATAVLSQEHILAEALDMRKVTLQAALERGLEVPVQRALRLLTAAVAAVEEALSARANLEKWSKDRLEQCVQEVRLRTGPLMNEARAVGQMYVAIADWGRKVRVITTDGCGLAEEILAEKSENYTRGEMGYFLQQIGEWSRMLEELLTRLAAAGWAERASYEEASAELRGALQLLVKVTEWIKQVHDGLPEVEQVPEQGRQERVGLTPPRANVTLQLSWMSGGHSERTFCPRLFV